MPRGEKCPTCGQGVRVYRRTIRPNMAFALQQLYDKFGPTGEARVVEIDQRKNIVADFEKLRYWSLIHEGASPGLWKITTVGMGFLRGNIKVPKYVWIFRGKRVPPPDDQKYCGLVGIGDIVQVTVCKTTAIAESMPRSQHLEEQTPGLFTKEK